jgi:hypothetical protein
MALKSSSRTVTCSRSVWGTVYYDFLKLD